MVDTLLYSKMVRKVKLSYVIRETLHKQTKNCPFMAGSQHFSPGDIQSQLVYDRGQCAESSYLKVPVTFASTFQADVGKSIGKLQSPQTTLSTVYSFLL